MTGNIIARIPLLLVAVCSIALGQEYALPVQDLTGHPVSSSGTVTMSEHIKPGNVGREIAFRVFSSATNNSSKPVILFVQRLRVQFSDGTVREIMRHYERFFASLPLKPAESVEYDPSGDGPETVPYSESTTAPKCTSETLYVEFDDGVRWGDAQSAAEILDSRQKIWSALGRLSDAYQTGGMSAFEKLLNDTSQFSEQANAFLNMLRIAYKNKGDQGAIDQLHAELVVAGERQGRLNARK